MASSLITDPNMKLSRLIVSPVENVRALFCELVLKLETAIINRLLPDEIFLK